jgi:predicted phosphodiesterase
MVPLCSDDDFIAVFERDGPEATRETFGFASVRGVYSRRESIEKKIGRQITVPDKGQSFRTRQHVAHPYRVHFDISDGVILIGSDAHYWPHRVTAAHRAFVRACKEMKPKAVIMNGDVLDGARISRHPPIGWESRPTLVDEIEACKERLAEIQKAAVNAKFVWTLGNHDSRFETRLATVAPEYAKIHGVHLSDHFPEWQPAWSCWINDDVVVKHRFKGGVHATHNNTVAAGKTMVTGHLHSLKVTPYDDYNGTRWGVDTGTLAAKDGEMFVDYTEDGPKNWRSGFAVLTFHKGRLLWPEVVNVSDEEAGEVEFRGRVYAV